MTTKQLVLLALVVHVYTSTTLVHVSETALPL